MHCSSCIIIFTIGQTSIIGTCTCGIVGVAAVPSTVLAPNVVSSTRTWSTLREDGVRGPYTHCSTLRPDKLVPFHDPGIRVKCPSTCRPLALCKTTDGFKCIYPWTWTMIHSHRSLVEAEVFDVLHRVHTQYNIEWSMIFIQENPKALRLKRVEKQAPSVFSWELFCS